MSITIELAPELESQLDLVAKSRGISREALVQSLVETNLPILPTSDSRPLTERIAAFHQFVGSLKSGPVLTDEAMSRETIYKADRNGNYID